MSKKNLVVDDESKIVGIVPGNLEQAGFNVCVAYDGRRALLTRLVDDLRELSLAKAGQLPLTH